MKKQFNREVHISTFAGNKYCSELREDDVVIFRIIFESMTTFSSLFSSWQHGNSWGYYLANFERYHKLYPRRFRYTFNDGLPKER